MERGSVGLLHGHARLVHPQISELERILLVLGYSLAPSPSSEAGTRGDDRPDVVVEILEIPCMCTRFRWKCIEYVLLQPGNVKTLNGQVP